MYPWGPSSMKIRLMLEHLNVHPRRCADSPSARRPSSLEVFEYEAPSANTGPQEFGHRRAPCGPTLTISMGEEQRRPVLGEPTTQERQRSALGVFPCSVGNAPSWCRISTAAFTTIPNASPRTCPMHQQSPLRVRVAQRCAMTFERLTAPAAPPRRYRQRLGGSRLPVREALRILVAEGGPDRTEQGCGVPCSIQEVRRHRMRERLEPLALSKGQTEFSGLRNLGIQRIEQGVMSRSS